MTIFCKGGEKKRQKSQSIGDDHTRRLLGDVINEVKNATNCRASPFDLYLKTFINNM